MIKDSQYLEYLGKALSSMLLKDYELKFSSYEQ